MFYNVFSLYISKQEKNENEEENKTTRNKNWKLEVRLTKEFKKRTVAIRKQ